LVKKKDYQVGSVLCKCLTYFSSYKRRRSMLSVCHSTCVNPSLQLLGQAT